MPQSNFTRELVGLAGQPTSLYEPKLDVSRYLESLAETWTVTFGGTIANGDYSFFLESAIHARTITVTRTGGTPADNTAMAAALVAQLAADVDMSGAYSATSAAAVATIVSRANGRVTNLTQATAPGGATLVLANTVSPGSTNVLPGRFVARGTSDGTIRVLESGDTAANIDGMAVRSVANLSSYVGDEVAVDAVYAEGRALRVRKRGVLWIEANNDCAPGDTVFVVTSGADVGKISSGASGATSTAYSAATFVNSSVTNQRGQRMVEVRL